MTPAERDRIAAAGYAAAANHPPATDEQRETVVRLFAKVPAPVAPAISIRRPRENKRAA